MTLKRRARGSLHAIALLALTFSVAACGGGNPFSFGAKPKTADTAEAEPVRNLGDQPKSTIWDLFTNAKDPSTTVEVNKYLWQASLEVLNFLPIQSVDPFSGVIVTGYGTPPGGGRAYRATVYVQDPALDARSLKVALDSRGGAVSPDTVRAVEDAILTRARQIRIRDSKL
ncbi:DUF3576 domain-containing protein [Phaeovulum sp.]|uniref:DUF3576 domain-containing protein n=1 Tax=Phaeovulum sp. TaxID=2934796 RepID=UPI0039E61DDA